MKLRKRFEKEVFIRLTGDETAFVCTAQWPLFSRTERIEVGEIEPSDTREVINRVLVRRRERRSGDVDGSTGR